MAATVKLTPVQREYLAALAVIAPHHVTADDLYARARGVYCGNVGPVQKALDALCALGLAMRRVDVEPEYAITEKGGNVLMDGFK